MKNVTVLLLFVFFSGFSQDRKGEIRLSSLTADHDLYVAFGPGLHFDNTTPYRQQLIAQLPAMAVLLAEYNFSIEKGIAIPEEKIRKMEQAAQQLAGSDASVKRLRNIFKVTISVATNQKLLELGRELEKFDEVAYCSLISRNPIAPPGDILPVTPAFMEQQAYIQPNPGVNMQYAWDAGLVGSGIRIRDVEYGFNKQHEEFSDVASVFIAPDMNVSSIATPNYIDHGTAVFGVINADNGIYGVTGMVHGADEFILFPEWQEQDYDRVFAVTQAIAASQQGDVILYEMQTGGQTSTEYVPAEYENVIWDLTKAASDTGIVIVAAAGNGNQNLDAAFYVPYIQRGHSGAIIIGAGSSDLSHDKLSFSTFGSRVDLQGWGGSVLTAGYGSAYLIGGDYNQSYTNFTGTSSAASIVASCVVAVQSYYFGATGDYLSASVIKNILQETGIAQGAGGNIGPLPNIKTAFEAIDLLLKANDNKAFSFSVYPNPASGYVMIGGLEPAGITAELFNAVWQLVYKSEVATDNKIDISGLSAGVYFLKVMQQGRSATKKIIKE